MEPLTIGKVAKRAQVNVETVRYYERRGLIPEPPRRRSGYRQYSGDDVARIKFIKHAKEVGFTLREISELLSLRVDPHTTSSEIKKKANAKINEIEEKIRSLQMMKIALSRLATQCRGEGPTSECPILEALSEVPPPPKSGFSDQYWD